MSSYKTEWVDCELSDDLEHHWPRLTDTYRKLFDELSSPGYEVRNVYEHYVLNSGRGAKDKPVVVLRIDVDNGFHLSWPLALHLDKRGLTASHYFLTHPQRYYDLWQSQIPRKICELGQEVGVHSDHYYEELVGGKDALPALKADIKQLSAQLGTPVKGMVYHGHPGINDLGKTNWMLTKDLKSEELGLEYHDGLLSCYIKPGAVQWEPDCDARISDYMGLPNSWGWNYVPGYPVKMLKRLATPGKVVHIAFHTANAFKYWQDWPDIYGEIMPPRDSDSTFWIKRLKVYKRLMKIYLAGRVPPRLKKLVRRKIKGVSSC